jgi:hypothetical protein
MNGQTFRRAIGCVPNITSSKECDAGQTYIFLTQHFLEENGAILHSIEGPAYERLSCRNVLKPLGRLDLSAV